MTQAEHDDTVRVHYTGKLEDGTVFDSSAEGEPLQFTLGEGEVIPGFEDAVQGMEPGESKTVEISEEEGYGAHRDELVMTVNEDQLPADMEIEVGQQLQIRLENGQTAVVRVTDISDSDLTLDANHPLAGEDLTFEIELVEIV
jgi:peptidylprolyl isomerase